jgi:hypothetical protein
VAILGKAIEPETQVLHVAKRRATGFLDLEKLGHDRFDRLALCALVAAGKVLRGRMEVDQAAYQLEAFGYGGGRSGEGDVEGGQSLNGGGVVAGLLIGHARGHYLVLSQLAGQLVGGLQGILFGGVTIEPPLAACVVGQHEGETARRGGSVVDRDRLTASAELEGVVAALSLAAIDGPGEACNADFAGLPVILGGLRGKCCFHARSVALAQVECRFWRVQACVLVSVTP